MNLIEKRQEVTDQLKTVFDPELGMNVYDLGLIYGIDVNAEYEVNIVLTFTSPACPFADMLLSEIREKIENLDWISKLNIEITFEPLWSSSMMSEEALLQAGLL